MRSVVSVVSVLGNKKGHTELTELTEKVASREIISVVPVWVKKVTRNSQNSRKRWTKAKYLWFQCVLCEIKIINLVREKC